MLVLRGCSSLLKLPSMDSLTALQSLDLSGCVRLEAWPPDDFFEALQDVKL
jgi:hypothetical protein